MLEPSETSHVPIGRQRRFILPRRFGAWATAENGLLAASLLGFVFIGAAQFANSFVIDVWWGPRSTPRTYQTRLDCSVWTTVRDLWDADLRSLAVVLAIFSGALPYVKVAAVAFAVGPRVLRRWLPRWVPHALYYVGKWAFFDVWLAVAAVAVMHFSMRNGLVAVESSAWADRGVFAFFFSVVYAQIISVLHVIVAARRIQRRPRAATLHKTPQSAAVRAPVAVTSSEAAAASSSTPASASARAPAALPTVHTYQAALAEALAHHGFITPLGSPTLATLSPAAPPSARALPPLAMSGAGAGPTPPAITNIRPLPLSRSQSPSETELTVRTAGSVHVPATPAPTPATPAVIPPGIRSSPGGGAPATAAGVLWALRCAAGRGEEEEEEAKISEPPLREQPMSATPLSGVVAPVAEEEVEEAKAADTPPSEGHRGGGTEETGTHASSAPTLPAADGTAAATVPAAPEPPLETPTEAAQAAVVIPGAASADDAPVAADASPCVRTPADDSSGDATPADAQTLLVRTPQSLLTGSATPVRRSVIGRAGGSLSAAGAGVRGQQSPWHAPPPVPALVLASELSYTTTATEAGSCADAGQPNGRTGADASVASVSPAAGAIGALFSSSAVSTPTADPREDATGAGSAEAGTGDGDGDDAATEATDSPAGPSGAATEPAPRPLGRRLTFGAARSTVARAHAEEPLSAGVFAGPGERGVVFPGAIALTVAPDAAAEQARAQRTRLCLRMQCALAVALTLTVTGVYIAALAAPLFTHDGIVMMEVRYTRRFSLGDLLLTLWRADERANAGLAFLATLLIPMAMLALQVASLSALVAAALAAAPVGFTTVLSRLLTPARQASLRVTARACAHVRVLVGPWSGIEVITLAVILAAREIPRLFRAHGGGNRVGVDLTPAPLLYLLLAAAVVDALVAGPLVHAAVAGESVVTAARRLWRKAGDTDVDAAAVAEAGGGDVFTAHAATDRSTAAESEKVAAMPVPTPVSGASRCRPDTALVPTPQAAARTPVERRAPLRPDRPSPVSGIKAD